MFHDLNVPYIGPDDPEIGRTLAFLSELGYTTAVLATSITAPKPPTTPSLPALPRASATPKDIQLLRRITLTTADPASCPRLQVYQAATDILALRPITEKSFTLACTTLTCDIISLDLSTRLPYIPRFKTCSAAIERGIRFEICYSVGTTSTSSSDARRNLIANATTLVRATRGRGIVVSSETKRALGVRAPADIVNLCQIWGMDGARSREAIGQEAAKVLRWAQLRRTSFRGVVDVVDGGKASEPVAGAPNTQKGEKKKNGGKKVEDMANGTKRKAAGEAADGQGLGTVSEGSGQTEGAMSKREQKRRAKKARLEAGLEG